MRFFLLFIVIFPLPGLFAQVRQWSLLPPEKLHHEHILNIGADFARAPVFNNRICEENDTLWFNLGSEKKEKGNSIHVVRLSLETGEYLVLKYPVPDSLKADRRSQPGPVQHVGDMLIVQEGDVILEFTMQTSILQKMHRLTKGIRMVYADPGHIVLTDAYYTGNPKSQKVGVLNRNDSQIICLDLELTTPELTFYGLSRLVSADEKNIYVADIGARLIRVFDYKLNFRKQFAYATSLWMAEEEALKSGKSLRKLKKKDPFVYGITLAREYCSRVCQVQCIGAGQLVIGITHPGLIFEKIILNTRTMEQVSTSVSQYDEEGVNAYYAEKGLTRETFKAWDIWAYGLIRPDKVIHIQPGTGSSLFDLSPEKQEWEKNDYFVHIYVFQ